MEGLTLVRDASEKPRLVKDPQTGKFKEVPILKPGYPLHVAIALSRDGNVLPWSCRFTRRRVKLFSVRTTNIFRRSIRSYGSKVLSGLVSDERLMRSFIVQHLCGLRQRFVIRVTSNRKYKLPDASAIPDEPTFTGRK